LCANLTDRKVGVKGLIEAEGARPCEFHHSFKAHKHNNDYWRTELSNKRVVNVFGLPHFCHPSNFLQEMFLAELTYSLSCINGLSFRSVITGIPNEPLFCTTQEAPIHCTSKLLFSTSFESRWGKEEQLSFFTPNLQAPL
jgi:hypothetical protein